MKQQVFAKNFKKILLSNSKPSKKTIEFKNFNVNEPVLITICYNNLLHDLGLNLTTKNRSLVEKAINTLYDLSFHGFCPLRQIEIKERLVISIVTQEKKQKTSATISFNTNSFFIMYSNP